MSDTPQVTTEETTEYDNFLELDVKTEVSAFEDIFGAPEQKTEPWRDHWNGMPEYEQENNQPFKKLIVSFRTEEDYIEFSKLIDQHMTNKTKSIWHPKLDRTANSLLRWIEDTE